MPCVSRLLVVLAIPFLALSATAADPNPIEKQLAVQKAMATARQFLELRMPDDAILALEAEVANADGNKAFLTLMREAYLAQLYRLENAADPDAAKVEKVRRKLALLGGAVPVSKPEGKGETPAPPRPATTPDQLARPAGSDRVAEAVAAFNNGDWANAAKLFGSASTLTTDQKAAWGYCRIRL
ncbi:MAG TPA: hypothetical protein VLM40_19290, partial [Gemmata sp.]|nr:hypothetical protein [Gemmata sp.]